LPHGMEKRGLSAAADSPDDKARVGVEHSRCSQVGHIRPASSSKGRQCLVSPFGKQREQQQADSDVADSAELQPKDEQAPQTGNHAQNQHETS